MYLDQMQLTSTQQTINISAKLIASIKILQCSAEELEHSIARELSENPALELEELAHCLRCGAPLRQGFCAGCDRRTDEALADPRRDDGGWDDSGAYTRATDLAVAGESDYDPLEFVRGGATLHEHLLRQLGAIMPTSGDDEIAEYLVGSLNSHGYVTVTVMETAEALRVSPRRVKCVLGWLQLLDPPGIGARDLRECLLIQLRAFEEHGETPPVARHLIEGHLHELGEHHFAEIARAIGVTVAQV